MPCRPWRFWLLGLILLVASQAIAGSVFAQTAYTAFLSSPDITDFPHLSLTLDVHDPSGAFVHGLAPQDVNILEGENLVPISEIQEQNPGVQFVVSVSPGDSFTVRDGLGVSRYEYFLQGLFSGTWISQSKGGDDFSLVTLNGPQVSHSADPAVVKAALEGYKPEGSFPEGLEVLSTALQMASTPTRKPGMERAILWITAPQKNEVSLGLQSIIASANQQKIRVFVWLVASQDALPLPETDLLRNLAQQTAGTFFSYTGTESVPDLETLLDPLRYIYQLRYDSLVTTPGPQQVAVQLVVGNETITTPPITFDVNLLPPSAAFLSLPGEIVRSFTSTPEPGQPSIEADLVPFEQAIEIQVAFPDGYDRALSRTSLFVDGVLNSEKSSASFTQLTWDLRPYTQGGEHIIRVEVVDSLGLTGSTGDRSVNISVPSTTQNLIEVFSQKRNLLVGVVVFVSASVVVLVLILGGRIRPRPHPGQVVPAASHTEKTRPATYRERLRHLKDPVTQPVRITPSSSTQGKPRFLFWIGLLPWFRKKEKPKPAVAYLLPLPRSMEPTLPAPLQIYSDDITLGRDAAQSTLVIDDPSIEKKHARIHHEGASFIITDSGSIAGTWVNFAQVPPEGTPLEHADIIHLGGVGFRFNLANPGPGRKTVITPLEPGQ